MADVVPHATSDQPDERSGASAGGGFSATAAASDADLLSAIGRGSASAWLLTVAPPSVDRLWIGGALDRLPRRERSVIELAYFDDLSQSAIAAQLDVPLGTVKSWT